LPGSWGALTGLLALALVAVPPAAQAQTKKIAGLSTLADGKQLWHHEIVKILNDELGATPQNLILVFAHCGSGGAIDAARGLQAANWSVATSTKGVEQCSTQYQIGPGGKTSNPAGSMKATELNGDQYDGFGPQWIRAVRDDVNKTVKGAFDDAKMKDIYGPNSGDKRRKGRENPRYQSSGAAADGAKLNSGTSSNHAILFFGDDAGLYDLHIVRELNNRLIDKYKYRKADIQLLLRDYTSVSGYETDGFKNATKENFEKAVRNLKQAFADKPNKEQLLLWFSGHGKTGTVTEKKKADAGPNAPGQGVRMDRTNNSIVMTVDPEMASVLFEDLGVPGAESDDFQRARPPTVTLVTFEESVVVNQIADLQIGLRVDPQTVIPLAVIDLVGTPGPHQYEVDIPDSALLALASALGPALPSQVELVFDFADPDTSVRLSTEDDYLLGIDPTIDLWGVGLTATMLGSETEPFSVTGSAGRLGEAGAGNIGMLPKFSFTGTINVATSTVTIDNLLNEVDGAGELVAGLPSILTARPGGRPNAAIFETRSGAIPKIRVEIQTKDGKAYDFVLREEKATIALPLLCPPSARTPRTNLTTSFTIDDGVNPAVLVSTEQAWRCLDFIRGTNNPRSLRVP